MKRRVWPDFLAATICGLGAVGLLIYGLVAW